MLVRTIIMLFTYIAQQFVKQGSYQTIQRTCIRMQAASDQTRNWSVLLKIFLPKAGRTRPALNRFKTAP